MPESVAGEEHDLAVRAFTRGWDIFHPPRMPLFRRYRETGASARGQHWKRAVDARRPQPWHAFEARSVERLRRLFFGRGLPCPYGLGSTRTLDDSRRASTTGGSSWIRSTSTARSASTRLRPSAPA